MPDLRTRFQGADRIPAPHLWEEITSREPRPLPADRSVTRRVLVPAFAFMLAVAGIALVVHAFNGNARRSPAATPSGAALSTVTARVADTIEVGPATSVAYGLGSVWVSIDPQNSSDRAILRIDPQSARVLATIPTPIVPGWDVGGGGLVVAQGSVWVAGGDGSGAIVRIDPSTNEVTDTIRLSQADITDVAVDEVAVWALTRGDPGRPEIIRIDPSSDQVVATIPLNGGYGRYIFASGGSILAALAQPPGGPFDSGTLVRIDPTTNQVAGTFDLGTYPSVAIGDGMMWVLTETGKLVQIDPATDQPISAPGDVSCTGDALGVGAGGVWCFDPARNRALTRFNPVTAQVDVAMGPDQGSAGTALATSPGSVWVVSGDRLTRVDLEEAGAPPGRLVLVLGDPHPGIFSVATDGSGLQQITSSSHDLDAAPSPDGKKIAFVRHGIYVMDADGTDVEQLTADGSDSNPSWLPDGTAIAFSREIASSGGGGPNADIFTVPVVGGPVVRITDDPLLELEPAWSPDGTRIAFAGYEQPAGQPPTPVRLYVMRSDGTGIELLGGTDVADPSWSPDGSQIAFAQELGGLFVIGSDGSNPREVYAPTGPQSFTFSPSWSPDGTRLAFVSGDAISDLKVFIIDTDGSGLKQLPIGPSDYLEVSWAAST